MVGIAFAALMGGLLVAAAANAQTTPIVQTLFLHSVGPLVPSEASVIGADAALTTYAVDFTCGPPMNKRACDYLKGVRSLTLTQNTTTYMESLSENGIEATGSCSIDGTISAVCTAIAEMDVFRISVTESATLTDDQLKFYPVTITAGAEKLAQVTETGTGTTAQSATGTGTGTEIGSASDNGALPRITGLANWAIGGGAMAVALAAM